MTTKTRDYNDLVSGALTKDKTGKLIVIGQLTRRRTLIYYEIEDIRQAIDHVENAPPKQILRRIELLREKMEVLVNRIEDVLVDYGDTDPRH